MKLFDLALFSKRFECDKVLYGKRVYSYKKLLATDGKTDLKNSLRDQKLFGGFEKRI